MTTERFPGIPEPSIVTPNYAADLQRMVETYYQKSGHYPGQNDPEMFLLEQIAYERSTLMDEINDEARQNLLAYAVDERLDHIGLMVGATRLPATGALTSVRLYLTSHSGFVLKAGFEMRAIDGETVFASTEDVTVDNGAHVIEVTLTCLTLGEQGNGFTPGQITEVVTGDYPIERAANTTLSAGGSEVESNDAFAYRIYLAPSQFSNCGPYEAYEYFALSANPAISSVYVHTPAPNEIELYALLYGGVLPTEPIKAQILAACSGKTKVPMGDVVSVQTPTSLPGQVRMVITVYKDYESLASDITQSAKQSLTCLLDTWRNGLGRDVVIGALEAPVQSIAGVYNAAASVWVGGHLIDDIRRIGSKQCVNLTLQAVTFDIIDEDSQEGF